MKLAEALLLRRDLESKLTLLREEIASSAVIQEGDTLDRSIDDLLLDYETTNQEFAQLVIAINQRNAVAKIGEQETIAAALEKREALRRSHAMLTATLEAAKVAPRTGRFNKQIGLLIYKTAGWESKASTKQVQAYMYTNGVWQGPV